MTAHTQRAIIVAREAFVTNGNLAAHLVDTVGGDRTFAVPLRLAGDATNTIRARWCNWALTPAEVTALRQRLQAQGADAVERTTVTAAEKGSFVPVMSKRLYVFDARDSVGWTPQEVLDVLGLDTLAATQP